MRDLDALHAEIARRQHLPFKWGRNDCVTFAAACVKAQTGVDPLEGVKPWRSAGGAARALRSRGGFFQALPARLTEVAPAFAKRGDVALVATHGLGALMIVEGETLVGPGLDGLVRLPRAAMLAAWSAEG